MVRQDVVYLYQIWTSIIHKESTTSIDLRHSGVLIVQASVPKLIHAALVTETICSH